MKMLGDICGTISTSAVLRKKRTYALLIVSFVALLSLSVSGCLDKEKLKVAYLEDQAKLVKREGLALEASLANSDLAKEFSAIFGQSEDTNLEVAGVDTEIALDDVENDVADCALINILPEETPDPSRAIRIAPDGVKFIANPSSEYEDFNDDDLYALVNGEEDYFDETIYLVARSSDSHSWGLLEEFFPIQPEIDGILQPITRNPRSIVADDETVLERVLADPQAIGMVAANTDCGKAKLLSYNGLAPDDSEFPGNKPFVLYVADRNNTLVGALQDFFASTQGKQALEEYL
ncbi:MAG: hypothetical protein LBJ07_04130 [Actinomycetes bacterium]|jgi:hypothetical protein|nr:hypothetical protein [Actinomycetes bacterium]